MVRIIKESIERMPKEKLDAFINTYYNGLYDNAFYELVKFLQKDENAFRNFITFFNEKQNGNIS